MSRPAVFTQGDISKLLKGAKAAGVEVTRVEIDRTGKIVAQFGALPAAGSAPANEWDEVLSAEKEQPAQGRH
jgi:hypothetical protein